MKGKRGRLLVAVVFGLAVALAYARICLLLQVEQQKVRILSNALIDQSFSTLDSAMRQNGRLASVHEVSSLDFPDNTSLGEVSHYRIKGGLMVKVIHRGNRVISIDLRKLEFQSDSN